MADPTETQRLHRVEVAVERLQSDMDKMALNVSKVADAVQAYVLSSSATSASANSTKEEIRELRAIVSALQELKHKAVGAWAVLALFIGGGGFLGFNSISDAAGTIHEHERRIDKLENRAGIATKASVECGTPPCEPAPMPQPQPFPVPDPILIITRES